MKIAKQIWFPTLVALIAAAGSCGFIKHGKSGSVSKKDTVTHTNTNRETVKLATVVKPTREILTDTGIKKEPVYIFILDSTLRSRLSRMESKMDTAAEERRLFIIKSTRRDDSVLRLLNKVNFYEKKVVPTLRKQAKQAKKDKTNSFLYEQAVLVFGICVFTMLIFTFIVTVITDRLEKRIIAYIKSHAAVKEIE